MWTLDKQNKSQEIVKKFEKIWLPTIENARNKRTQENSDDHKVGILLPLWKTFWSEMILAAIFKFISSLMTFVNPIVLDWLIAFITNPNEPTWKGIMYALLMFTSPMIESILNNQHQYMIASIAMRVKSCLISAIFKKGLRLSSSGKKEFTTGEIVNLMAVDTDRIMEQVEDVNIFWSAPLQIGIALYLLWAQLGISILAGVGVMIFSLPYNAFITSQLRKRYVILMDDKDARIRMMNEILNGIKVLKLYAWENSFKDYVMKFRSKEVKNLKTQAWLNGQLMFIYNSAPFMVSYINDGHHSFLTFLYFYRWV